MVPASESMPLHHVATNYPLEGTELTVRVLILRKPDGTTEMFSPLVEYMIAYANRSATWQYNVARALGLFWDYCQQVGPSLVFDRGVDPVRLIFRRFAYHLLNGTRKDGHCIDATGLYWPKMTLDRATLLSRQIERFAQWCVREGYADRLGSFTGVTPTDGESAVAFLMASRLRNASLLHHIKVPSQTVSRVVTTNFDFGSSVVGSDIEPTKRFPTDYLERLLWEGHVRPRWRTSANPIERYNLRDQMVMLLQSFGGVRESEPFHLWVQDVCADPRNPEKAMVVLHHPSEGIVTEGMKEYTRHEWLNRYGLLPRNLSRQGNYHAGWKNLKVNKRKYAHVFWIDDVAATLFWTMYQAYVRLVRTPLMMQREALLTCSHQIRPV